MATSEMTSASAGGGGAATLVDDQITITRTDVTSSLVLNGGDGTTTLQLQGGGTFDLRVPQTFTSIERIVGSDRTDLIDISVDRLSGVTSIEAGGGAFNFLRIHPSGPGPLPIVLDLSGKTFQGFDAISLPSPARVTLTDTASALQFSGDTEVDDELILVGSSFSPGQRQFLFSRGIDKITDASGTYENAAPTISGLDGDHVRIEAGGTVFLDAGLDAGVSDDQPALVRMLVTANEHMSSLERLGLDTGGSVVLSGGIVAGTIVKIREGATEVEIGTIAEGSDPQAGFEIQFTANATLARVQALIHALTYTHSGTDPSAIGQRYIEIHVTDAYGRSTIANVTATVAPNSYHVLTQGNDTEQGTDSDETFVGSIVTLRAGDVIDGGGGTDTFQSTGGTLDLTLPTTFTGIEIIKSGELSDEVIVNADRLAGIETLDGGAGSFDWLRLGGETLDLRGKTITGFEGIVLAAGNRTVAFAHTDNWANALLLSGHPDDENTVMLTGASFTLAQRQAMFSNGIEKVADQSGVYTSAAPQVASLNGDTVRAFAGGTFSLDVGRNATITDDGENLGRLKVEFTTTDIPNDALGIATGGSIALTNGLQTGSGVRLSGSTIGTLTNVTAFGFEILFNDQATPTAVTELLHALTYTNNQAAGATIPNRAVKVSLWDKSDIKTELTLGITQMSQFTLTAGADNIVGTAEADVIVASLDTLNAGDSIDGGGGTAIDTLQSLGGYLDLRSPATFTGIEVLQGSDDDDNFVLDVPRLAGITAIHGGAHSDLGDALILFGARVDLTGKTITGFEQIMFETAGAVAILDSNGKSAAVAVHSAGEVVLNGAAFSTDELKTLFRQGVQTITDANGTHTNQAPQLANLHTDRVLLSAGQTAFLDVGRNASITDDYSDFGWLHVDITEGATTGDELGFDPSSNVRLEDDGGLKIGDVVVGIRVGNRPTALEIYLHPSITAAQVEQVLYALTYKNQDAAGTPIAPRTVTVTLTDGGNKSATATVTVAQAADQQPGPNARPTGIALSATAVDELARTGAEIGTLSATDPNAGDTFTFSLVNPDGRFRIEGSKLVVANGFRLDAEQAGSHQVTVRVTDRGGLSLDKTFTITVANKDPETTAGSAADDVFYGGALADSLAGNLGHDRLFGGAGADRLSGEAGNDTLAGGAGKDVLIGGKGAASRDAFVFDTKLTKANYKLHLDTITDFEARYDAIYLDDAAFGNKAIRALGKGASLEGPKAIKKGWFTVGEAAKDRDDYVIWNKAKGTLWYDADGIGAGAAVQIAKLAKGLTLTAADFFIV
jgi:hypothetical protein